MAYPKHCYYGETPSSHILEPDFDGFDDRTLASLIGKSPRLFNDGMDNDDPYRALPLGRRTTPWVK